LPIAGVPRGAIDGASGDRNFEPAGCATLGVGVAALCGFGAGADGVGIGPAVGIGDAPVIGEGPAAGLLCGIFGDTGFGADGLAAGVLALVFMASPGSSLRATRHRREPDR
jgi:hypothetical protein